MLLQALVIVTCLVGGAVSQVDFECDPYGTIFVTNPDPSNLIYAHAVDYLLLGEESHDENNFLCPTTMLNILYPKIVISPTETGYCGKGRPIMLTLSNASIHDTIMVSMPYKQVFIVRCTEIDSSGITVNVTQELQAIDTFDDVPIDYDIEDIGKTPDFDKEVRSNLYPCCSFNEETESVTSALVGTHLLWTLDVYNDYHLLPILCRAHAGRNSTGSPSAEIIENGCMSDPRLVTYNSKIDSWTALKRRVYVMNLYAFHFYNSPYITIICHIKVCPKTHPENCDWDCSSEGRKKKSAPSAALSHDLDSLATTVTTMHVAGFLNHGPTLGKNFDEPLVSKSIQTRTKLHIMELFGSQLFIEFCVLLLTARHYII